MNLVYYGKDVYQTPSTWNELRRRQLLEVIGIFHAQVPEVKGFLMILRALTRIPWWKFLRMQTPHMENAAREVAAFLMEKNDLTRNIIPRKGIYFGPSDHMQNLKCGEFCFTEIFYSRWKNEQDEASLDRLVAVLYRRPKLWYNHWLNPAGDRRVAFNPNLIDHDARRSAKWNKNLKLAIAHFYEGCRNEKMAANPKVFENGNGEESVHGMWSVMRNVAKAGHFGSLDNVMDQYVDTILMELNEVVVEAERMEAEMKKKK